eukprot:scaffold33819_cov36-Attheya_sp.AAC.1
MICHSSLRVPGSTKKLTRKYFSRAEAKNEPRHQSKRILVRINLHTSSTGPWGSCNPNAGSSFHSTTYQAGTAATSTYLILQGPVSPCASSHRGDETCDSTSTGTMTPNSTRIGTTRSTTSITIQDIEQHFIEQILRLLLRTMKEAIIHNTTVYQVPVTSTNNSINTRIETS